MKPLAVKEEEKRLRRYFNDNIKITIIDDWREIRCHIPQTFLSDRHVKRIMDEHLYRHFMRKFKWVKSGLMTKNYKGE